MKYIVRTIKNGYEKHANLEGELQDVANYLSETPHDTVDVYSSLSFQHLSKLRFLLYGPIWRPLSASKYGDLITLEQFFESVAVWAITEDDGSGYYATSINYSNVVVDVAGIPGSFKQFKEEAEQKCPGATHIHWYNK